MKVLISHGHFYTFRSHGFLLSRSLSKQFSVHLAVPREFQSINEFKDLCSIIKPQKIFYIDNTVYFKKNLRGFRSKVKNFLYDLSPIINFRLVNSVRGIFKKEIYDVVIMHDYIERENIYISHFAKKKNENCKIIICQGSQPSNEKIIEGFKIIKKENAIKISGNLPLIREITLLCLYTLRYFESYFRNIIYPIIFLKKVRPYLGLSAFNNVDIVPKIFFFDYFLVHQPLEKDFYNALFQEKTKVKIILNAIQQERETAKKVFTGIGKDIILCTFSLTGLISKKQNDDLEKWKLILDALHNKFPEKKIYIKLHPSSNKKFIKKVKKFFNENDRELIKIITGTETSAESLVVSASIIIGDASSILIWASYFGNRIVASIDLNNYPNSGDMKRYKDILVSDDPIELTNLIINEYKNGPKSQSNNNNINLINNFLLNIRSKSRLK